MTASTPSPPLIHQKIKDTSPTPEEHDFILWTDGSGYDTGHGASASILLDNETGKKEVRISANSTSTTHRAEFDALLNGLQAALEMRDWNTPADKLRLDQSRVKPSICWFGDSESLMLATYIDEHTGKPAFQRRLNGDLWYRYAYYETAFHITPIHIPRNSMPEHALADRLAGEARLLLKEYMECLKNDHII